MPRNNLSRRFNPKLAERNDLWDRKFCSLFWSPFEIDKPRYRRAKGRVKELPANEEEEEPVASGSGSSPKENVSTRLSSKMKSLNVADTDSSEPDPLASVVIAFSETSPSSDGGNADADEADPVYGSVAQQLPFQCAECPKRFRLVQYLRSHSVVHKPLVRPFGCDCGKRFRHRNALYHHRKRAGHHDWQATDVKCFVCGQRFRSSAFLARHTAAACARNKAATQRKEKEEEIVGV